MAEYFSREDIGNRALQHIGAARIDSFEDDSKNAAALKFAYDKLRTAELRRNLWSFAIKTAVIRPFDTDTMILNPRAWSATVYYQPGNIVSYGNQLWVSPGALNIANTPGEDDNWEAFFGPMTADEYDSTLTYSIGEVVYVPQASGGGFTPGFAPGYISRFDSNSVAPGAAGAYAATASYDRGDLVTYLGSTYISLVDLNVDNTPASAYALYVAATTYASGNHVITLDGAIWLSQASANTGNNPATDDGTHWQRVSSSPYVQPWLVITGIATTNTSWRLYDNLALSSSLKKPSFIYPAGAGPMSQDGSRNVYMLPAGFMRLAPQSPKTGSSSYLGAPGGLPYTDWDIGGKFLVTEEVSPIPLRFIANISTVTDMDTMFCEGLAARLAFELCEELTQSTDKKQACWVSYKNFMTEARIVSAIETGAVELAEDDYITTRA